MEEMGGNDNGSYETMGSAVHDGISAVRRSGTGLETERR